MIKIVYRNSKEKEVSSLKMLQGDFKMSRYQLQYHFILKIH